MSVDSVIGSETDSSPTVDIVEEVAAVRGVPTDELEPLYTAIDPDALERLFSGAFRNGRVEFEYEGCTVVAESGGHVAIVERERRT